VVTKFGQYIGPEKALHRAADHVSVAVAREKASVMAAHATLGTLPPSKSQGVKFEDAFEAYFGAPRSQGRSEWEPPMMGAERSVSRRLSHSAPLEKLDARGNERTARTR
jgi:hypothetical protein